MHPSFRPRFLCVWPIVFAAAIPLSAQTPNAAPSNAPFPVSIQVDAARPIGEMKPIWRFFGADEPNYATMKDGKKLIAELGELRPEAIYFRAHNLLCTGDVSQELGRSGMVVWAAGCMPAFDIIKRENAAGPRADDECTAQNAAVKSGLKRTGSLKKILLLGRWAYYFEGRGLGVDSQNLIKITNADFNERQTGGALDEAARTGVALRDTVHWLKSAGYEVYVLEQMPEIPDYSSRKLFQAVRSGQYDVQRAIALFGTVPRVEVDARQRQANEVLDQIARDGAAKIIQTHYLFCDVEKCSAWSAWGPAYSSLATLSLRFQVT